MPMELGGQLNKLIRTRSEEVDERRVGDEADEMMGVFARQVGLHPKVSVYMLEQERVVCKVPSCRLVISYLASSTAEVFSFEYFLVQLMSFSPQTCKL